MTARRPSPSRRLRCAALVAGVALPLAAAGDFDCARSVAYNARWCAGSVVVSVSQAQVAPVCAGFTRALAGACRKSWDRVRSCDEFAQRFQDLLVAACLEQNVPAQACQGWSDAFAVGPLGRCERGKTSY